MNMPLMSKKERLSLPLLATCSFLLFPFLVKWESCSALIGSSVLSDFFFSVFQEISD
jgi:hypothetical protein